MCVYILDVLDHPYIPFKMRKVVILKNILDEVIGDQVKYITRTYTIDLGGVIKVMSRLNFFK